MSPTTSPSGCADKSICMIRSRGSVPIAENMSAYFATRSARFLAVPLSIFPYLRKYGCLSTLFFLHQRSQRHTTRSDRKSHFSACFFLAPLDTAPFLQLGLSPVGGPLPRPLPIAPVLSRPEGRGT